MLVKSICIVGLACLLWNPAPAQCAPSTSEKKSEIDLDDAPTFINSDSLTLKSADRVFEYSGKVEVKHGDLTLNSETLQGQYDDKNQITNMVARNNVVITKGEKIKATSQKAVYEKSTDTLTLTENPQVEQEGSMLTADVIKILLKEDRSIAEGSVRVKLLNKDQNKKEEVKIIR